MIPRTRRHPRFKPAATLLVGLAVAILTETSLAQSHLGAFERQIDGLQRISDLDYDPQGVLHTLDPGSGLVRRYDAEGDEIEPLEFGGMRFPSASGLAVARSGRVFVADSASHEICFVDRLGNAERIASLGTTNAQVNDPRGMDTNGAMLIAADTGNKRIQIFDVGFGEVTASVVAVDQPGYEFSIPEDVAVDESTGRFYVVDSGRHLVYRFSIVGELQMVFGGFGEAPGLFNQPTAVAFKDSLVYVADTGNHRVQVFDAQGTFQYWWGLHTINPHDGNGRLHYPTSIAPHPSEDRIAVGESFEDRVQFFGPETSESRKAQEDDRLRRRGVSGHFGNRVDSENTLLAMIEPETARVRVYDTRRDTPIEITNLGGFGTRFGKLVAPTAVAVDGDNQRVLVGDSANGTLSIYRLDRDPDAALAFNPSMSRFARSIDIARSGAFSRVNLFHPVRPVDIDVLEDGRILVLDAGNGAVVELDSMGVVRGKRGAIGYGSLDLAEPDSFCVLPDGRYAVTEPTRGRIALLGLDEFDVESIELGEIEGVKIRPEGIEWDGRAMIVADANGNRVLRVSTDGEILETFGGPARGLGPDAFCKPSGLVVTHRGLFVSDHGNHRLVNHESFGVFRHAFGPSVYTDPANLAAPASDPSKGSDNQ